MRRYESYKDSGIDWLGEIPAHWELKRSKFVNKIYNGNSLNDNQKSKYQSDNLQHLAYISSKDINLNYSTIDYNNGIRIYDYQNFKVAPNNTSLICIEGGSAGRKIAFTNEAVCFVNKLACVTTLYPVNSKFVYYSLKGSLFQTQFANAVSGLIGGVSISALNGFLFTIPSIDEQHAMSLFLDQKCAKIDALISVKEQQIELLKEEAQAVIYQTVTRGITTNVKLKDSGIDWIGKIPEHWIVEKFKNILDERNEKNNPIKTEERLSLSIDKGITLYSEKTTNLDRFKDDFSQYKLAYKGDLVFNSMNMIVGAVGVSNYFGCVSPVYYTYHSNKRKINNTKFYEYIFRSKVVQKLLYSLGKGLIAIDRGEGKYNTLRLKVSREDLRSFEIVMPPLEEQNAIVDYLNNFSKNIDRTIFKKLEQIAKLKEYKQSVINEVVTGKIKVC